jgi:TRAP-type C4-dicarboxylate transport system permease small subunit
MFLANVAIVGMILIGAFMRYLLKLDFYGSEELVLLIASWMYFLGSAAASYEDSQVSADLISSMIKSDRKRAVFKLCQLFISLFLFGLLVVWAFNYFFWSLERRPATPVYRLPMAISYFALLFSFFLSFLYQIMHICKTILFLRDAYKGSKGAVS